MSSVLTHWNSAELENANAACMTPVESLFCNCITTKVDQESNICGRMNAYLECGFQCLDLSMIESLLKVPSQAGAPPLAT